MEGALVDVMNVNGFLDDGQVPDTQLSVSPRDQVPRREGPQTRGRPIEMPAIYNRNSGSVKQNPLSRQGPQTRRHRLALQHRKPRTHVLSNLDPPATRRRWMAGSIVA